MKEEMERERSRRMRRKSIVWRKRRKKRRRNRRCRKRWRKWRKGSRGRRETRVHPIQSAKLNYLFKCLRQTNIQQTLKKQFPSFVSIEIIKNCTDVISENITCNEHSSKIRSNNKLGTR